MPRSGNTNWPQHFPSFNPQNRHFSYCLEERSFRQKSGRLLMSHFPAVVLKLLAIFAGVKMALLCPAS